MSESNVDSSVSGLSEALNLRPKKRLTDAERNEEDRRCHLVLVLLSISKGLYLPPNRM